MYTSGDLPPGIARVFLDQKHIPGGMEWEQVFVKAVANCLVLVPLLSWYDVEDKNDYTNMGSVGQLMALHTGDRIDNFLLEIVIANALMQLPAGNRWLQRLEPIFIGLTDDRGFTDFPFQNIGKLPDVPSLQTAKKAAEILMALNIPVDNSVIAFSVKEHISRVTQFQGIKLSMLGADDIAMQSASTKLVNLIPQLQKTLSQGIMSAQLEAAKMKENKKEKMVNNDRFDVTTQENAKLKTDIANNNQENNKLKIDLATLKAEFDAFKETQDNFDTRPLPSPVKKSSFCVVQ